MLHTSLNYFNFPLRDPLPVVKEKVRDSLPDDCVMIPFLSWASGFPLPLLSGPPLLLKIVLPTWNNLCCMFFVHWLVGPFSAPASPTFADCSQIYVLLADDRPDESHQPPCPSGSAHYISSTACKVGLKGRPEC